jgi:hypothetical protein
MIPAIGNKNPVSQLQFFNIKEKNHNKVTTP